jgi:hypothetical protein
MSNLTALIMGVVLGSALTVSIVGAGSLYDPKGNVRAPAGSPQQFDYFRQRQQYLDINAMRHQTDRMATEQKLNPCGRQ